MNFDLGRRRRLTLLPIDSEAPRRFANSLASCVLRLVLQKVEMTFREHFAARELQFALHTFNITRKRGADSIYSIFLF